MRDNTNTQSLHSLTTYHLPRGRRKGLKQNDTEDHGCRNRTVVAICRVSKHNKYTVPFVSVEALVLHILNPYLLAIQTPELNWAKRQHLAKNGKRLETVPK